MRFLITRPRPDAERTAEILRARGHEPVLAPLLTIVPDPEAAELDLAACQAILVTSANGARVLAQVSGERALPVFAVGDASARAARDAGFASVASAAGDVDSLAALVRARLDPRAGPLVHVAGSVTAGDLAGELGAAGFEVVRAVLYHARSEPALPAAAADELEAGSLDGILFFSPRTARAFIDLVAAAGLRERLAPVTAYCLSDAVAAELPDRAFACVRIAESPTQGSLLDSIG